MLHYIPASDRPPHVDGTPGQVLVGAGYHSPYPLLSPLPPPQPHSIQPIRMSPMTEERFMEAFKLFSNHTGIRLDEQEFFIEGRQVNPWELYRTVALRDGFDRVTMNGEWSLVGVDLGFPPVSCDDPPHPLAHCTPAVAHQLHQLYQDTLRHFDQAYSRGFIDQPEHLHTMGQRFSPAQPQDRHYQPLACQPTEADYQALLTTIVASESSSVMSEEEKNVLLRFYDVSTAELEAHRIPQHVIAYIERNREYLKWLAQSTRICTNFTPIGSPQFAHQNLFHGVQALHRPSLHSSQDYPQPQPQQRPFDWGFMHGDATNSPLPQRQTALALLRQANQGDMYKQTPDHLAVTQATFAHSFKEESASQQLPPGINTGGVPSGNACHPVDALSQHAQVSIDDQKNLPRHLIQTEDALHPPWLDTYRCRLGLTSRMPSNPNPLGMDHPQDSQGPGLMPINFRRVHYANVPSSSASSAFQPPPEPNPVNRFHEVPLSQLRDLFTRLAHIVMEGEEYLRSSGEGDIQSQLRARLELNKRRLRALQEIINAKLRESGDLTQRAVNGPTQSMSTLSTPYTGVQMTSSISSAGAQNHAMPVSMNPAAVNGVRSSSFFTHSPSVSQIRPPSKEDLMAAKKWIDERKRMAFSSVPKFDRVVHTQSLLEIDIQEYQRNLERLDQVLVNIEKYIHVALATLKKGEVVERLFKMMASAKFQLEELKKPNPRYVLELHTIRGMIQEADNMDKGLKAVLQRIQVQMVSRDGVPSALQPPPRLDSILILPPPNPGRDPPQGDVSEPARSQEGVLGLREGVFEEEIRITMSKLGLEL